MSASRRLYGFWDKRRASETLGAALLSEPIVTTSVQKVIKANWARPQFQTEFQFSIPHSHRMRIEHLVRSRLDAHIDEKFVPGANMRVSWSKSLSPAGTCVSLGANVCPQRGHACPPEQKFVPGATICVPSTKRLSPVRTSVSSRPNGRPGLHRRRRLVSGFPSENKKEEPRRGLSPAFVPPGDSSLGARTALFP
jgi:hypothetical protein